MAYNHHNYMLSNGIRPSVEIVETPNSFLLTANLQGIGDYHDIAVQSQDNALTLIGKRPGYRFTSVFQMPADSELKDAHAIWNRGTLIVNIPRKRRSAPMLYTTRTAY